MVVSLSIKNKQFEEIKQLNRLMVKLNEDYMRKYTSECENLILNKNNKAQIVDYKTKSNKWVSYNKSLFAEIFWEDIKLILTERFTKDTYARINKEE